jgi:hypothetical protein
LVSHAPSISRYALTLVSPGVACSTLLASGDSVYCAQTPLTLINAVGAVTQIASTTNNVTSMAVDDTNVYWVNSTGAGSVMSAPKQGGPNVTIAYDQYPTVVAVDANAMESRQGRRARARVTLGSAASARAA